MRARVRHISPGSLGFQIALDARFISAADNSSLATWSARKNALYGATAAGTAQPTFKASSINGFPAVQFDGTSDCMDFDSGALALPNNSAGMVAIAVAVIDNAAADATQNVVFFSNGLLNSSSRFAMRAATSNTASLSGGGRRLDADTLVGTSNITGATTAGVWQVYADWANNSLQCRMNGGNAVSVAYSSGAGNCSPTNSVVAKLGGQATGASRLSGRIAAVAIGSPLLGQPVRMRVRQSFGFSFKIATA